MDKFSLVYDSKKLSVIIDFLESGFKWDPDRSSKLFHRLNTQSSKIPKAAVHYDGNKIKIAILLIHQTYIAEKDKDVINLSAWYADKTHRGIEAIIFAKNLTLALDKFIITNYTPSIAASKIFLSMGYKDMGFKVHTLGVQKQFPFLKLRFSFNYFSLKCHSEKPINLKKSDNIYNSYVNTPYSYQINIIKKFGVKLSILNFYSEEKQNKFCLLWFFKMIFLYRPVQINFYFRNDDTPRQGVCLIKNFDEESYISPRNSELSI